MRESFSDILNESAISTDPQDLQSYGQDWLKLGNPAPSLVLFPGNSADVQNIVRRAFEKSIALVPSGGRTGLSGGASAYAGEVVISFQRMNRIFEISGVDATAHVEAGVVTQRLQEAAREKGLFFPVEFASKGTSQLGGNAATNAGGIRVIKYGLFRDWVLGLRAVTGSGDLLEMNHKLVKNQTGYDLRHLLIGSEGTLAFITELTLRLTRPAGDVLRVLCGLHQLAEALTILAALRLEIGDISAFEFFQRSALEKVMQLHGLRDPLEGKFPNYLVIEIENAQGPKREKLEAFFMNLMEHETVGEAVLSQSSKQADELMAYRERISETLSSLAVLHKNDVAVPTAAVPAFIEALQRSIAERYPQFEVVLFGHIGDGNIHINILKPSALATDEFRKRCHDVDSQIFEIVRAHQGTISAEHGVGILKKDFLSYSRGGAEIELMRKIKAAFDPKGILNPGKLL